MYMRKCRECKLLSSLKWANVFLFWTYFPKANVVLKFPARSNFTNQIKTLTCYRITMFVTIFRAQILDRVFHCASLARDFRSLVWHDMSVHNVCWLVLISKSIESNVEVSAPVNHVEVDDSTVLCSHTLTILDQSCLTRNSDAHEVGFVKHAFSQGHSIYSCCRRRIPSGCCTLQQSWKDMWM